LARGVVGALGEPVDLFSNLGLGDSANNAEDILGRAGDAERGIETAA
jgi:hypothetical protein